ncbi:MAG: 4-hydroxybenzoate octaprenyltransferase [Alphaproteobacteria bacterium]
MSEVTPTPSATDIAAGNWVERYVPPGARPYCTLARLDQPIGTWLLLWPCWWGLAMAAQEQWPDLWLMALFAVGALVMRGAGCTINDIADRDFDARVARTATRPLPSGALTPVRAWLFLAALLAAGFVVLVQLNLAALVLGLAALPLVALYPFMKRITWWPQAWLGLTFNWGALMGWTAVAGAVGPPALALYAAGIAWTLGYDTIYAHQDKEDDALIGVKSSARRLGDGTRPWLWGFYAVALALLAVAGALAGLAWPFYGVLAAAGGHLAWQAARVDIHDPAHCMAAFKSNKWFGLMVFAAIVAGQAVG